MQFPVYYLLTTDNWNASIYLNLSAEKTISLPVQRINMLNKWIEGTKDKEALCWSICYNRSQQFENTRISNTRDTFKPQNGESIKHYPISNPNHRINNSRECNSTSYRGSKGGNRSDWYIRRKDESTTRRHKRMLRNAFLHIEAPLRVLFFGTQSWEFP